MPTDDELLSGRDKELWFAAEALWVADHPKIPFRETFVSRDAVSDTRDCATESQQLDYLRRALAARRSPPGA